MILIIHYSLPINYCLLTITYNLRTKKNLQDLKVLIAALG